MPEPFVGRPPTAHGHPLPKRPLLSRPNFRNEQRGCMPRITHVLRILDGVGDSRGKIFGYKPFQTCSTSVFALVFPIFLLSAVLPEMFSVLRLSFFFFFHPASISSEGCGTSVFLNRYLERYSERGGGRNVFLIKRYSASRLNETLLEA